jgi:quinol monooxygenase YgiN
LIIVAGTIDLTDPTQMGACLDAIVPIQQATRDDESGCLAYSFSPDPCVLGRLCVYELWIDQASLAAHFEHPNYTAMRTTLRAIGVVSNNKKYRCDLSEPVYDAEHRPHADFFTVSE